MSSSPLGETYTGSAALPPCVSTAPGPTGRALPSGSRRRAGDQRARIRSPAAEITAIRFVTEDPARLVFAPLSAYIGIREVGAGKRLANLVRSGRKQPQRAPLGSMSSLSLERRIASNSRSSQTAHHVCHIGSNPEPCSAAADGGFYECSKDPSGSAILIWLTAESPA